jgi:hypothetical protein
MEDVEEILNPRKIVQSSVSLINHRVGTVGGYYGAFLGVEPEGEGEDDGRDNGKLEDHLMEAGLTGEGLTLLDNRAQHQSEVVKRKSGAKN